MIDLAQLPAFDVRPVELRGTTVELVPLEGNHAAELASVGGHTADWQYLPIPGLSTLEEAEKWVGEALSEMERSAIVCFVLRSPESGRLMGSTRFMNIRRPHRGLEIGYTWLGQQFQRSRVNTEAKRLLLSHAFDRLGALRVELKTDGRNVRSQRAIERIGAKREGTLRAHMIAQNGYVRDTVLYSITRADWPAVRAGLDARLGSLQRR